MGERLCRQVSGGYWIKASIVFFCLALAGFFSSVQECLSRTESRRRRTVWWSLLAAGMIGGLLLVILFDMSPAKYELEQPSLLGRLFF